MDGALFELVAHRGNAADFPENTLPAFASALDAGLGWIELDVQLSADHVPFVIHDAELGRTTRARGDLRELPATTVGTVDAGEPARFGDRFAGTALPRLTDVAALLGAHPQARAFVELKRASLSLHGRERCVDGVIEALDATAARCVAISFDAAAVALARSRGCRIGWVLERFSEDQLAQLRELGPDFAFYDFRKAPVEEHELPAGPWRWAVYEVRDAARARYEASRGATLVESMDALRLRADLAGRPD